jgi:hypothetical protein
MTTAAQPITIYPRLPWTYSQLEAFETCPKQYFHTNVLREYPFEKSEASLWGDRVHDALERRVRDGVPLPNEMAQWNGITQKLLSLPGDKYTEQKMAIDRAFQPVNYYDKERAWTRGKIDLTIVHNEEAVIADYKTGKKKPSEQLYLYCTYVFAKFTQVNKISSAFLWLKDRKVEKNTVHRGDIPSIWQRLLPRVSRLDAAYQQDKWPPTPNGLCRQYCPVLGCEFNGRKGT